MKWQLFTPSLSLKKKTLNIHIHPLCPSPILILLSSPFGEGCYLYLTLKPMSILRREILNKFSYFYVFIKQLKLLEMHSIISLSFKIFHLLMTKINESCVYVAK